MNFCTFFSASFLFIINFSKFFSTAHLIVHISNLLHHFEIQLKNNNVLWRQHKRKWPVFQCYRLIRTWLQNSYLNYTFIIFTNNNGCKISSTAFRTPQKRQPASETVFYENPSIYNIRELLQVDKKVLFLAIPMPVVPTARANQGRIWHRLYWPIG